MGLEEFKDLVRRMRDAQDDYFANRGSKVKLNHSIQLENMVDVELGRKEPIGKDQLTLF